MLKGEKNVGKAAGDQTMKITKQLLKEMIEEELALINEEPSKDGPSEEDMMLGKGQEY